MNSSIVWRLLRRNISIAQLAGYAIANLAGLAIVLTALQFYRDVTAVWSDEDSFISRDYIIISQKVSSIGSLLGNSSAGFSEAEIADIESQPWVRRVGRFTTAGFNVSASVDMGGRGMSTALFLESIPDDFIDITPSDWHYTPGKDRTVPIILSKEYLTLYNFGFASSRGLPQVSESMMGMIPIRLSVSGNGSQQWLQARIVGFSSRLNTIAVPEEFMEWANASFADEPASAPSRLIVEVNTPGDPAIAQYLDGHGYESAGDKADNGRAAYFLTIVTAVVMTVGIIISLLAFFILLLSIYLLLQKNRSKLRSLMMLGYTPWSIARHYCIIVAAINAGVLIAAMAVMLIASALWSEPLASIGVTPASPLLSIFTGICIMALITSGNIMAIRRNVKRTFPQPHKP